MDYPCGFCRGVDGRQPVKGHHGGHHIEDFANRAPWLRVQTEDTVIRAMQCESAWGEGRGNGSIDTDSCCDFIKEAQDLRDNYYYE